MKYIEPRPETILALRLLAIAQSLKESFELNPSRVACDAAKVCSHAYHYRALNERGCNVELTTRQENRKNKLAHSLSPRFSHEPPPLHHRNLPHAENPRRPVWHHRLCLRGSFADSLNLNEEGLTNGFPTLLLR